MELGHMTDALPHLFSMAANFSDTMTPTAVNAFQDVIAGLTQPEAMPAADRTLQLTKIVVAGIGLGASIGAFQFEAIAACALAEGEALFEIGKRGHHWRAAHASAAPTIH